MTQKECVCVFAQQKALRDEACLLNRVKEGGVLYILLCV